MKQLRLTLSELEYEEQKIRENLGGIVKNFVQTGWHLSRIERSGAYKLKGYSSITEYARETFGMAPDGVSRFLHVYEKYSIPGDTPKLREEYQDFNFSQLTEMLHLPEEDHLMIRPETKREDIRDLKKFNKQSEHNPDNLLNWKHEPGDIIREIVKEFFKARKKDLNNLYETYGIGPYPEETIKRMARFLYHEKKRKFQTDRAFMMLYPDQVFIKNSEGELNDITWEEFFEVMGEIFDSSAAGVDTWENYFNSTGEVETETEIPGQDNIMNHPEYLPGKLHGRKFEHCIYLSGETCIAEDCGACEKKQLFEQRKAENHERAEKSRKREPGVQKKESWAEVAPAQVEETPEALEKTGGGGIPAETRKPDAWPEDLKDIPIPSKLFIQEYLEEEEKTLKDYLNCGGLPEKLVLRQQLKVAGLRIIRNLCRDAQEEEEE